MSLKIYGKTIDVISIYMGKTSRCHIKIRYLWAKPLMSIKIRYLWEKPLMSYKNTISMGKTKLMSYKNTISMCKTIDVLKDIYGKNH